MIVSNQDHAFGSRLAVIEAPNFNCKVSTAKEGFFAKQSTVVLRNSQPYVKIIYEKSLNSKKRLDFHDVVTFSLDGLGNQQFTLDEALCVMFKELIDCDEIVQIIELTTKIPQQQKIPVQKAIEIKIKSLGGSIDVHTLKWIKRLQEVDSNPEIFSKDRKWRYYTSIACVQYLFLAFSTLKISDEESSYGQAEIMNLLDNIAPIDRSDENSLFIDIIAQQSLNIQNFQDCCDFFGQNCQQLQSEGIEHKLIAPNSLGNWIFLKSNEYYPENEIEHHGAMSVGLIICQNFTSWWDGI